MIRRQVTGLILAFVLGYWSIATWAATQTPKAHSEKTTYILVIDSSGSMKEGSKDPSQYFDPARQQTRWDFMLNSVQGFLESLENDTVVHLILFGKYTMPAIEYPIGAGGVSAASIRRDIANYAKLDMFASRGKEFIRRFDDKTALYNTLGKVMKYVRTIAGARKDRPIEILFFADGAEDLPRSMYLDSRIKAAKDNASRSSIISKDFEKLVQQDGYTNTWLYFTWLVNKDQFTSNAYRRALNSGQESLPADLPEKFAHLLRQRPLLSRPGNHIVYDLPYPKLPIALTPRRQMLANPQRANHQQIILNLEFSNKAATLLKSQKIGLQLPEELQGAAGLTNTEADFQKGRVSFGLEIYDSTKIKTEYSYRFPLIFPQPQMLDGVQIQAPREVEISFAPLTPPKLEITSPINGATYYTGDTLLLQVAPLHAQVEWTINGKQGYKGRRLELPLENTAGDMTIAVRAIDPDVPTNSTSKTLHINIARLSAQFDGFPTGKVIAAGTPFTLSVLGSPEISQYQWSVNRNTRITEGKTRPRADGKPGSELTLTLNEPRDYRIRLSARTRDGSRKIQAKPNPLILTVRPKPAIHLIAPDPDIDQQYALAGVPDSGPELRAEVFGNGYEKVQWLLKPVGPVTGSLPELSPSAIETGPQGNHIARKRLAITEAMGVEKVQVLAQAIPTTQQIPVLRTEPITITLIPPRRDVILTDPPVSSALYYSSQETVFTAEVLGRTPKAVRWTLVGPDGNTKTTDEAIVTTPSGKRVSHFRYLFLDPSLRNPKGEAYRLQVAGVYTGSQSQTGSQGQLTYSIRHLPKKYHVELKIPEQGVAWNATVKTSVMDETGLPVAGRVKKIQWTLIVKSGQEHLWETDVPETSFNLAQLDPEHAYEPKRIRALVFDRVQGKTATAERGIFIKPGKPQFSILLNGNNTAGESLTYGDTATLSDHSSGDIVTRRWVISDRSSDGKILQTRTIKSQKQWAFRRDMPQDNEITRSEITLYVTDPTGQTFPSPVLVISNILPLPMHWFWLTLGIMVIFLLWANRYFTGNQPLLWRLTSTSGGSNVENNWQIGGTQQFWINIADHWQRWKKHAIIPINSFEAIGDALEMEYGNQVSINLSKFKHQAKAAVSFSDSEGNPLAAVPGLHVIPVGDQNTQLFYFEYPANNTIRYEITVKTNNDTPKGDSVRLGLCLLGAVITLVLSYYGVIHLSS